MRGAPKIPCASTSTRFLLRTRYWEAGPKRAKEARRRFVRPGAQLRGRPGSALPALGDVNISRFRFQIHVRFAVAHARAQQAPRLLLDLYREVHHHVSRAGARGERESSAAG